MTIMLTFFLSSFSSFFLFCSSLLVFYPYSLRLFSYCPLSNFLLLSFSSHSFIFLFISFRNYSKSLFPSMFFLLSCLVFFLPFSSIFTFPFSKKPSFSFFSLCFMYCSFSISSMRKEQEFVILRKASLAPISQVVYLHCYFCQGGTSGLIVCMIVSAQLLNSFC